jgi:predicted O-linked N-acetylglucosamine transferase (SPINDLY family)
LSRKELGLRDNAVVFLCGQSLFKYLPQYDILFSRIVRQIDDCQFVFFSSQHSKDLTGQFMRRIARTCENEQIDVASHVLMLPRVDHSTFQAIARVSDIYLDSIDWSGCNTTLECLVSNLPAITCKGSTMRGCHTYAFLKMMGMEDLIASDLTSYINLAVRFAQNNAWRNQVRDRIPTGLQRIFRDTTCIRALEDFLLHAAEQSSAA